MTPRENHPSESPLADDLRDALPTLELDVLARALNELGRHAAAMDQADESLHEACQWCETMKLFSRVADFGGQIRAAEKHARS